MSTPLIFEAEPFEVSSLMSRREERFEEASGSARARTPPRVPSGGGRYQRETAEEERADLEFEGSEGFETLTPPGGGRYDRGHEVLEFEAGRRVRRIVPQRCVPAPRIITLPSDIARARAYNTRTARSLLWGNLIDQIEVNIFRCPRAAGRLSPEDFLQAVALFQRTQKLKVDGMLGPITWTRMKTIRAERDPFPRAPVNQAFDIAPNAGLCEMHTHPAIDLGVVAGTPIPCVADGRVIYAGAVGSLQNCPVATGCTNGTAIVAACATLSYGRAVIVEHPNRGPGPQPGGASVYTVHAHVQFAKGRRVATGEPVVAGRILAEVGADCVGFSTGAHLHYVVVTGPRQFRLRGGPSRIQICGRFWPAMTPQRPRSIPTAAAFRW
jgi:hypothetical protein